jgi:hypothetical protein
MAVFWLVAPSILVDVYHRLRRACSIALIMETASISETSVNFYQTTQRNNPEDSDLHIRRRENLKSQLCVTFIQVELQVYTSVSMELFH